jgi:hypothetical protein
MRRTPESRVLGMTFGPCQRSSRCLATHRSGPGRQPRIVFPRAGKLREKRRILIARKQPEPDAVSETKSTLIGAPPELNQAAVLIDRSGLGDPQSLDRTGCKQIASPQPGFLLAPSNGETGLVADYRGAKRLELRGIPSRIGNDLCVCPILDRRACRLE